MKHKDDNQNNRLDNINCTQCEYATVRANGVVCSYAPFGLHIFSTDMLMPQTAHCNRFVQRKQRTR